MTGKMVVLIFTIAWAFSGLGAQENEQVKRHIEVSVELAHGDQLEGIVVDGRFYERYNERRNRWQVMPSRKNAGLRLYHVEKAEGFIFINYEDIKRIEEIGKKSDSELQDIREEIRIRIEKERFEAERDKLEKEKREAGKEGEGEEGEKGEKGEKDKEEGENKEGLSEKTLVEFAELLEKYPPKENSLEKTIQAVKIRMNSGIPLSNKHKEFLLKYPIWRQAVAHKEEKPLKKTTYTEAELEEAKVLTAKFPKDKYSLEQKVNKLSINALNEIPLFPDEEEWFQSLDKWLDAEEIIALDAKKKAESSESEEEEEEESPKKETKKKKKPVEDKEESEVEE